MMLRKLISASLACLLIFSCTAGVLAAPPEQMDPSEAIAPEEAVDSAYTYDENGILTEYVTHPGFNGRRKRIRQTDCILWRGRAAMRHYL